MLEHLSQYENGIDVRLDHLLVLVASQKADVDRVLEYFVLVLVGGRLQNSVVLANELR